MNLKALGTNQVEVKINDDITAFFSYNTCVACFISGQGFYKTSVKWSNTTTKHINKWLDGRKVTEKNQEFFDNLVK